MNNGNENTEDAFNALNASTAREGNVNTADASSARAGRDSRDASGVRVDPTDGARNASASPTPSGARGAQNASTLKNALRASRHVASTLRNALHAAWCTANRRFRAVRIAVIAFAAVLLFVLALKITPFPALTSFMNRQYSTRFYDRSGVLLQILSLEDGIRREWTDLDDIPKDVQKIFIDAEDKNFYRHFGVHIPSVVRAVFQNTQSGKTVSGASTITMQLARIIVPRENTVVTVRDKIREAWIAIRIEAKLSKKQILELYLNNLPFGYRTEGIASAARNFYGSSIQNLSTEQAETLALIPRRPAQYITLVPSTGAFDYPNLAPHFILWVRSQYQTKHQTIPPELVLSIDSTLTDELSDRIAYALTQYESARVTNGTGLVIDNYTGEIVAWCGSTDFYEDRSGQIDGVLVKNQVGSSMKPFLYALALENGFSPSTVLGDVPSDFGTDTVYVPQNFNNRFNGPQLFRTCLASSLNIPAVYLLNEVGMLPYYDTLSALGFDSLTTQRDDLGLSLALGSGEVQLFELVRAFSVFTREGSVPVLRFTKAQNEAEQAPILNTVYKRDTARIICDMLSDKKARSLGFGFARVFDTPYPAIFKTGTSNQFQNIVALGSTKRYTVGVWMGNVTGETVIGETGSSIPAAVVRKILDILEDANPVTDQERAFTEPELYEKQPICALSGMAPTPYCTAVKNEYVLKGSNREPCTWHYRQNGKTLVRYPDEYQRWLGGRNMNGTLNPQGVLRFFYPIEGAVYLFDAAMNGEYQQLRIDVAGGTQDTCALYVDGVFYAQSARPFTWYIPVTRGVHFLSAQSGDDYAETTFTVK